MKSRDKKRRPLPRTSDIKARQVILHGVLVTVVIEQVILHGVLVTVVIELAGLTALGPRGFIIRSLPLLIFHTQN